MNTVKQHSIIQSILFHLIPGALATIAYILIAPFFLKNGYPALLAILIASAVVLIPIEMGILFYQAKRTSGTFSLKEVVLYRDPLPKWQYVVFPLGLVIWAFLITSVTGLLDIAIAKSWFSWLPEWFFLLDLNQLKVYSQPTLTITFVVRLIVNGILAPIVEELYFRGYLLPRIERFGKWAPLLNTSLFSLYHFWAPEGIISRIIWMLPGVSIVRRKRNIYINIIAHCAMNTIGGLLQWGLLLG